MVARINFDSLSKMGNDSQGFLHFDGNEKKKYVKNAAAMNAYVQNKIEKDHSDLYCVKIMKRRDFLIQMERNLKEQRQDLEKQIAKSKNVSKKMNDKERYSIENISLKALSEMLKKEVKAYTSKIAKGECDIKKEFKELSSLYDLRWECKNAMDNLKKAKEVLTSRYYTEKKAKQIEKSKMTLKKKRKNKRRPNKHHSCNRKAQVEGRTANQKLTKDYQKALEKLRVMRTILIANHALSDEAKQNNRKPDKNSSTRAKPTHILQQNNPKGQFYNKSAHFHENIPLTTSSLPKANNRRERRSHQRFIAKHNIPHPNLTTPNHKCDCGSCQVRGHNQKMCFFKNTNCHVEYLNMMIEEHSNKEDNNTNLNQEMEETKSKRGNSTLDKLSDLSKKMSFASMTKPIVGPFNLHKGLQLSEALKDSNETTIEFDDIQKNEENTNESFSGQNVITDENVNVETEVISNLKNVPSNVDTESTTKYNVTDPIVITNEIENKRPAEKEALNPPGKNNEVVANITPTPIESTTQSQDSHEAHVHDDNQPVQPTITTYPYVGLQLRHEGTIPNFNELGDLHNFFYPFFNVLFEGLRDAKQIHIDLIFVGEVHSFIVKIAT